MCNIAGYVGTKQAAPIIVEMLRKQEGWDSGYYTGIGTICDGEFYMEKGVGSLQMLLVRKDVTKLPGNIGFIHGRSYGNEGDAYAHPFTGTDGDILYLANGTNGAFRDPSYEKVRKLYAELKTQGCEFLSHMEGDYPMLPGGGKIHGSDLMCQQIVSHIRSGMSTMDAMEKAYCDRVGEIVGLTLNRKTPDRISFARINYPMFVAIADHGMYMATTPQAFPEDAREIMLLPALSCGEVYADRYVIKPFKNPPCTVADITPEIYAKAYAAVVEALQEQDRDHDYLDKMIKDLFRDGDCAPEPPLDYMILNDLEKQGRLETKLTYVRGVREGTQRPKFFASLIK